MAGYKLQSNESFYVQVVQFYKFQICNNLFQTSMLVWAIRLAIVAIIGVGQRPPGVKILNVE